MAPAAAKGGCGVAGDGDGLEPAIGDAAGLANAAEERGDGTTLTVATSEGTSTRTTGTAGDLDACGRGNTTAGLRPLLDETPGDGPAARGTTPPPGCVHWNTNKPAAAPANTHHVNVRLLPRNHPAGFSAATWPEAKAPVELPPS